MDYIIGNIYTNLASLAVYLMHVHSCFALIGAHRHRIAVGFSPFIESMNGENSRLKCPLLLRLVQSTTLSASSAPHNACGICWLGTARQFSHDLSGVCVCVPLALSLSFENSELTLNCSPAYIENFSRY